MIGLFGGSFDPVHLGHVAAARELLEHVGFREIRFLPAARSPLKDAVTADRHRLAMLERALAGQPGLVIDTSELGRPPPSYTIDTLRRVRAGLGPDEPLVFIMGLDSLLELPLWKEWRALTDIAHLLVVSRPGSAWPVDRETGPIYFLPATGKAATAGDTVSPAPASTSRPAGSNAGDGQLLAPDPALADWLAPRLAQDPAELAAAPSGRVLLAATMPHDIASRRIRAAIHGGADTSRWLAPAVRDYIDQHHIYSGDADPQ